MGGDVIALFSGKRLLKIRRCFVAATMAAALGVAAVAPQNAQAQIVSSPSSGCTAANAGDFDFVLSGAGPLTSSPFSDEFAKGEVLTFSLAIEGDVVSAAAEDATEGVEIFNSTANGATEDYIIPESGDRDFDMEMELAFGDAAITVSCAPAAPGSITIVKNSGGLPGDFQFNGDLGVFTLSIVDEPVSRSFDGIPSGDYLITEVAAQDFEVTSVSCAGDADNGSVVNLANGEVTIDLDPGEDVLCTFTNGSTIPSDAEVAEVSRHAIRNYLYRRANALLSEGPDRARIVRKSPDLLWEDAELSVQANNNGASADFAFSSGDAVAKGVDLWVEGSYSSYDYSNGGDHEGDFGVVYIGADYLLTKDFLVGVLGQFDWSGDSSAAMGEAVSGNGWMAGPYVSARLSKNLFFDARAAWGRSDNTLTIAGYVDDDEFDTTRWLLSGALTGNRQFGNWRITPTASVSYIEDRQHSYVSGTGAYIDGQTVALGRATFEPELAYRHETESGLVIEPQIRLAGLWDFDTPDGLSIPGWTITTDEVRMRVEGGFMLAWTNGFALRAAGSYDGIGAGGFDAYGARLWLDFALNRPKRKKPLPAPAVKTCADGMLVAINDTCPVATPADMSAQIQFTAGKAGLSNEAYAALASLWSAASGETIQIITIAAGGDADGVNADDMKLAERRAQAVMQALERLGASPDVIAVSASLAANGTAAVVIEFAE